jgi:hypothetical protein
MVNHRPVGTEIQIQAPTALKPRGGHFHLPTICRQPIEVKTLNFYSDHYVRFRAASTIWFLDAVAITVDGYVCCGV